MRNHGVVCCASTMSEAIARVKALELSCAIFFRDAIGHREASCRDSLMNEVRTLLVLPEEMEFVQ